VSLLWGHGIRNTVFGTQFGNTAIRHQFPGPRNVDDSSRLLHTAWSLPHVVWQSAPPHQGKPVTHLSLDRSTSGIWGNFSLILGSHNGE
jgi:hypothetical protein